MKISDKALELIIQDVVIMDELKLETGHHSERLNMGTPANTKSSQKPVRHSAKIIPFPNINPKMVRRHSTDEN